MPDALELLKTRRSLKPVELVAPGPTAAEIDTLLTIASRVPDHGKLVPWRFIVFEGDARAHFGETLAEVLKSEEKEPPSEVRLDTERARFKHAPLVIALISQVKPTPGAPELEQVLSCGAAAQNLCLAANALGFGTCWLTGWAAFSPGVAAALKLKDGERVAGFIHIGTAAERQTERPRPDLASITTRWTG